MSCVGSRRSWDERVVLFGGYVYPWRNRAGDVRVAVGVFFVVVLDGGGGALHAACGERLAALRHFRHDCRVSAERRRLAWEEAAISQRKRC